MNKYNETDEPICRKALKESFLGLLEKKKFENITVTQISEKAFVNRGTFYFYFKSKEELYNEMVSDAIKLLQLEKVMEAFLSESSIVSSLERKKLCEMLFASVYENQKFFIIIFDNIYTKNMLYKKVEKMFYQEIEEVENQVLPKSLACNMILTALFSILKHWVHQELKCNNEIVEKIAEIFENCADLSLLQAEGKNKERAYKLK